MTAELFTSSVLSLERDGHIATLWLNRPAASNAMGKDFWADFPTALSLLDHDERVRVIIVAAKGKHFCAGLDLREMGPELLAGSGRNLESGEHPGLDDRYRTIVELQEAISSVAKSNKPVIAAIHGACIGSGVDLISACDIRLSSEDATYSVREARLAIVADLGSLQRLPHIIGAGHSAELALSAKDIDAHRAAQINLVNDALGDASAVYARAKMLAEQIASNAPAAVQGTKAVLRASIGQSIEEGLAFVAQFSALHLDSNDLTEAITAYFEKRPPKFTGS